MRKFVQEQALELISTLWDGIAYIISKKTKQQSAIAVLQDCYLAIDAINNSLMSGLSEERYLFYNKLIDELKDMLKQLNRKIIHHESTSRVSNNIKKQLTLIKKELTQEQEVKLEVVFMPYKASMWDCFESIWRATKEDTKCDCYIMPIPYYSKNPDGSFGEFHYEGGDFPNDVPIINYKDYDLNIRRPDIIYIHNPFDQYNYITSVDPNYYSHVLKKYTDMLVYVPYFVTGKKVPENQRKLSVFNHMDKMIVQSEEHKQIYGKYIPESKLVALGSPKVDRIIYYENHKPSVSKEWLKRIENKKVVMYNTSISGILKYGIKALQKMIYVFSLFKGRDDVVLLWRPHPLIESTLKAMNTQLLRLYLKIKRQYLVENIGIYDTTPDITESISLSDAYIGEDSSSVVHLFGVAGKPIFLMDLEIPQDPTEEEKKSVHFWDFYFENNIIWFVSDKYNALCKMDLETGKIEVIDHMQVSSILDFQYCDISKIDSKVIIQPHNAGEICEYDLQERVFIKRPFKDPMPHSNFDRMIHYKDYIFMKPKSYSAILRYDIRNGDIKYYSKCLEKFMKCRERENEDMFMWGVSTRDNLLLMASSKTNQVLEFNMDTGKSKIHTVGSKGSNYFGMTFDGADYWLIPNEGKAIVRWNYETGKTEEYSDFPENFSGDTKAFINIICCGSYLLAFPRTANMIVKIDIATGNMSEFDLNLPYKEGQRKSSYYKHDSNYYFAKKIDDRHIVALSAYDNSLVIVDTQTETYSIKKCRLNTQDMNTLIANTKKFGSFGEVSPYVSRESAYWTLEQFLNDSLINDYHNREEQKKAYREVIENMDGTCGEKTHEYIKKQVFKQYK